MNSLPNFPTDRFVEFVAILLLVIYGLLILKMTDTVKFYAGVKNDLYISMIENPEEIDFSYIETEVDRLNKERLTTLAILLLIAIALGFFFIKQSEEWRKQDKKLDQAQDLDLKLKQAELDLRKLEIKKLEQET